jgi:hypothetical protein
MGLAYRRVLQRNCKDGPFLYLEVGDLHCSVVSKLLQTGGGGGGGGVCVWGGGGLILQNLHLSYCRIPEPPFHCGISEHCRISEPLFHHCRISFPTTEYQNPFPTAEYPFPTTEYQNPLSHCRIS